MANQPPRLSLVRQLVFSLLPLLIGWAALECLAFAGAFVRFGPRRLHRPFIYQDHPYRAYAPIPGKRDHFLRASYNSLGLRGAEIAVAKPPDTVRIVCLGGSTTFGDKAATDTTAYPARMERILREHYRDAPFRIEVVNAGIPAYTSLESLIVLQTSLLDLSPDVAVAHQGLNDCFFMLKVPGFQSDYRHGRKTLSIPPPKWWEYSPMLSLLFARDSIANPYYPAEVWNLNIPILVSPKIALDPKKLLHGDLHGEMTAAFERDTRSFIALARGNGVIPVLSTQTHMDDGPAGGPWIRAMEKLNQVTRDVAANESVAMIDFARAFPWNSEDYADAVHLNDTPGGLGRQAAIFAQGLINMKIIEQAWQARMAAARMPNTE